MDVRSLPKWEIWESYTFRDDGDVDAVQVLLSTKDPAKGQYMARGFFLQFTFLAADLHAAQTVFDDYQFNVIGEADTACTTRGMVTCADCNLLIYPNQLHSCLPGKPLKATDMDEQ